MPRRVFAFSVAVVSALVLSASPAAAQRRAEPAPRSRVVVAEPQRAPTVVYPPWYGPWGWGYPYGYQPYPYPYPYGPYRYYYNDAAELRIQATPRETEVYVDGARAGIVDDFDGVFQRLHLSPGDHEITLYLAGYRSWSEVRYFGPRSSQKILHTMLQLAPGQPDDPKPVRTPPPYERRGGEPGEPAPPPPQPEAPPMRTPPPTPPVDPDSPRPMPMPESREAGQLNVLVTPGDAIVTLDGDKQTLRNGRLAITLNEGVHHLVVEKPGYETFETDLQIRRGRTLGFTVELKR
jgi:hypothetical protein